MFGSCDACDEENSDRDRTVKSKPGWVTYGLYARSHLPLPLKSPGLSKEETPQILSKKKGQDRNASFHGDVPCHQLKDPLSVKSILNRFKKIHPIYL